MPYLTGNEIEAIAQRVVTAYRKMPALDDGNITAVERIISDDKKRIEGKTVRQADLLKVMRYPHDDGSLFPCHYFSGPRQIGL